MRAVVRLSVAIVVCLGLSLALRAVTQMGAHASIPVAGPAPHSFPPGSAQLYRLTPGGEALRALDARSLADRSVGTLRTGLRSSATQNATVLPTADGSRFVVVNQIPSQSGPLLGRDMTLQLFDTATGRPLSAIRHPAVSLGVDGVSANGSMAYGFWVSDFNVACNPSDFYQLDTRTGKILRHLTVAVSFATPMLIDPGMRYLYTFASPNAVGGCNSNRVRYPTLTAYDLRTGKSIRRIKLRSVLAGWWNTGRSVNNSPVVAEWNPGVALSPDGSQFAILDGHNNALTLIATPSLRIEGTETLTQPKTGVQALASAFGLAPVAAEAKGQSEGVNLQIQYTPDGRSLLVTGTRFHPDRRHPVGRAEDLGIRLVDIASGQIKASLHEGNRLVGVWSAPDGSAVYSELQGWTKRTGWLAIVQRRNPTTLQVRASRTFAHTSWLSLVFLRPRHDESLGM